MPTDVVIAGAGGMGREAAAWLVAARPDLRLLGFVAGPETPEGNQLLGRPVWSRLDVAANVTAPVGVVLGIGDPGRRRRVAGESERLGMPLVSVVHPTASLGPEVMDRGGIVVGPNATITRDAAIGRGVVVNYGAQIGHDARVGDFAFVGPGSVLGGDVSVGDDAFLGLGAVVLPGRRVGEGAVVGAGAVVTRDVVAGTTVIGVPARSVDP